MFFHHFTNIEIKNNHKKKFPSKLRKITFGKYFCESVVNLIPYGVTHVVFDVGYEYIIKNYIPLSVTHLTIKGIHDLSNLPNVTHLTLLGFWYNSKNMEEYIQKNISSSVVRLEIPHMGICIDDYRGVMPDHLKN